MRPSQEWVGPRMQERTMFQGKRLSHCLKMLRLTQASYLRAVVWGVLQRNCFDSKEFEMNLERLTYLKQFYQQQKQRKGASTERE